MRKSQKRFIIIISGTPLSLKYGAAYERIVNYTKCLVKNDIDVYYFSFYNFKKSGNSFIEIRDGIYQFGDKGGKSSNNLLSYFKFMKQIQRFLTGEKRSFSILVFPQFFLFDVFSLIFFKYICGYPVFLEKNERKIGIILNITFSTDLLKKTIQFLFYPFELLIAFFHDELLRYYSGVIAISSRMEKYCKKRNSNVIRIPILVDINEYDPQFYENSKKIKIGFFGTIDQKKEGIIGFLNSIATLNEKLLKNIELHLYGYYLEQMRVNILRTNNNKLKIFLNMPVPHKECINLLGSFTLFVLPRPSNIQNNFGFSTKLGEFMASGRPVIVTDISDNADIILDGVNGFIVNNENLNQFSEKIQYIFEHREVAKAVGRNAYLTARDRFDYNNFSKILTVFLLND